MPEQLTDGELSADPWRDAIPRMIAEQADPHCPICRGRGWARGVNANQGEPCSCRQTEQKEPRT